MRRRGPRLVDLMASFFRGLGYALAAGLILLLAGGLWFWHEFNAIGPLDSRRDIVIAKGAGLVEIAWQLESEGIVQSKWVFALGAYVFAEGEPLKAGELRFPAAVSPRGALRVLIEGKQVLHRLTVPEGLTVAEIFALLEGNGHLEGALPAPPPEGSLLPETYFFVRGDERANLVQRMQEKMTALLEESWAKRDPDLPLADPREAVILASIVEKETGLRDERAHIAGVFYNRLRQGIKLQADPTVIYAVSGGKGPLGRPLSGTDLKIDSPYNTYRVEGLPPGPIANPGRAALLAVLHPRKTKDIFFVADGKGGHAFAETLATHNENVAKWRAFLDSQASAPGDAAKTPENEGN